MRAGVELVRLTLQGSTVTSFGSGQLALLKIDVAELGVVMRLVEVMIWAEVP